MMHAFKVRWAELPVQWEKEALKQTKCMGQVARTLKRAGFVLDGTDPEGFAVYLAPDRPASKSRRVN